MARTSVRTTSASAKSWNRHKHPEISDGEEPYGPEAAAFTTEHLEGQEVTLEFDEERVDPYDRALAYVWLGDELLNETLLGGSKSS
jgi:micrococcal nuclease